jgi:LysR family transcriptional regulator, glycine cleavage system transcriptional activator
MLADQPLPPLASIRAFDAAARHGSFAGAARELGTTAASVSYHVRQLERVVGVQLFVRHPQRVELTPPGQTIADETGRAFAALRASFVRAASEDQTSLAVTVLPSFGTSWLTPRLGRFRTLHPEIRIELELTPEARDLGSSRFDAAVRNGHGNWPGLNSVLLFPSLFTPLCAPHLAEAAAQLDDDPPDLPPLLGRPDWWQKWFAAGGRTAPLDPARFGVTLEHEYLDIAAAVAGQGIAIGSPIIFGDEIAAGRLVMPQPRIATDGRGFWLTYPRARRDSAKLAKLRDWLMSETSGLRPE